MSAIPFQFTPNATIYRAVATNKKIIVRGSNVETADHTVTIFGKRNGSAIYQSETLTISGTASKGKIELQSAYAYDELKAVHLSGTMAGGSTIFQQGTAGTGDIRVDTNPADGRTVTVGLTGFTQAYRFKSTTAAAYDVKIGATAADTALNLKKAINADGLGDGTDYHTGTAANPYFSAAASGSTTVTITDRVASVRQLGVILTQSHTELSLRSPDTGVDGPELGSLDAGAGQLLADGDQTLDTEDLADSTWFFIPVDATSRSIYLGGRNATLWLTSSGGSGTVTVIPEFSLDGEVWFSARASTVYAGVTVSTTDDLDNQYDIAEHYEFVRLKVTASGRTTWNVNAKAVF